MSEEQKPKVVFEIENRGYKAVGVYLVGDFKADVIVEITKDETVVRRFKYPAYKVFNIAAHFDDIVDSEIERNAVGYEIAGSTGLGGQAPIISVAEDSPEMDQFRAALSGKVEKLSP